MNHGTSQWLIHPEYLGHTDIYASLQMSAHSNIQELVTICSHSPPYTSHTQTTMHTQLCTCTKNYTRNGTLIAWTPALSNILEVSIILKL